MSSGCSTVQGCKHTWNIAFAACKTGTWLSESTGYTMLEKLCRNLHWLEELRFLIWRFFGQSAFENNHRLCCWPTVHILILKICPKVQVLSSLFVKVHELFNANCAKKMPVCEVRKFQVQSMLNAIICINKRFEVKNSGIPCPALIFNLSNPGMTILLNPGRNKAVQGCKIWLIIFCPLR